MSKYSKILEEAIPILDQDRMDIYGDPLYGMHVCAQLNLTYARACEELNKTDALFTMEHQEAMRMVLYKIARMATGKFHKDNYLDAINYLAIAHGLAKNFLEKREETLEKELEKDKKRFLEVDKNLDRLYKLMSSEFISRAPENIIEENCSKMIDTQNEWDALFKHVQIIENAKSFVEYVDNLMSA